MRVENNIPEGWVETALGDISTRKQYGYTESASNEKIGPKFLRITDIQNDFISWDKVPYCPISDEDFTKYKLQVGDVVIARTGNSTGATATIKENIHAVFASYLIRFQINKQLADYDFIDFLLRSKLWDGFVNSVKSGSAQGGANANDFALFPIYLPPLQEQKAIAKVLTAFDNKTELLQAQNKTLETMAQTIFKEWFGKYQVGDELPEGWVVSYLSEIADFLNGLALQKYPPKKGHETLPVIKIRELKQGITSNTDRANTELDDKYVIDNGDVLFSWSGSLEVVIWQYGKGALNQHLFKVSSEIYPKWFYYHWVLHHLKEFKGIASSKATTMGHINRKHIDLAQVIVPDNKTFKRLDFLFSPILEKLENNQTQIQSLTKTRDTLLPKLMSGQVRVKNIKHTADA